jgi:hypothetical protein
MMKKLVMLFAFAFWAFTISLILSSEANAQKKGDTVTDIEVASPVASIIFDLKDDAGISLGSVDLQIYDRKHQMQDMKMRRISEQVKGLDPIRPEIKLILMDGLNYRLAESLAELKQPVDNEKVIMVNYMVILDAIRTRYD